MTHIVIDPGHGKLSRPIYQDGSCETDIVWNVALLLAGLLVGEGERVTLTKNSRDARPWVRTRARMHGDIFISLHCNAAQDESVSGVTSFFYGREPHELWSDPERILAPNGRRLARHVSQQISELTGLDLRGVCGAKLGTHLGVLRGGKNWAKSGAAILVECGFLTNLDDRSLLRTLRGQRLYATGVAAGIAKYLGVEK